MTESRIEKQIKSIVCVCGERKSKTKPFCRKCFTLLADDLKEALSNQLVEDFISAYATARERLLKR
jgi:CDGSH-type Zn-finger protein